jgi:hypothetical protein
VWLAVQRGITSRGNSLDHQALDVLRQPSVALGGSIYEPYTYRICAVNRSGRSCSDFAQLSVPTLKPDSSTGNRIK